MTTISLITTSVASAKADAVVVGVAQRAGSPPETGGNAKRTAKKSSPALTLAAAAEPVDEAFDGALLSSLEQLGATGKLEEIVRLPSRGDMKAPMVVVVGLGRAPEDGASHDAEALRRAAAVAVRSLAGSRKVALALPAPDAESVEAIAQGALLGAYAFRAYRTNEEHRSPVAELVLAGVTARRAVAKSSLTRALTIGEAVTFARDLVNTPPADLRPQDFATRVTKAAKDLSETLSVEVLDEKALKKGGYGGILGVGQGSVSPPRLVRVAYRHPKARKHLAYIGKGITFDTGGLSLKPPASMTTMKCDMAGAASVVAAVIAIARLGLAVNVTGWAPLAENMPSGAALRPSDVVRIYGGKTVEVLNTDAEGRVVMADVLVRAAEDKPDAMVDAATLTGAQMLAMGMRTGAVMGNDDEFRTHVYESAQRAGEAMWPMPLPEHLRASLDSSVADISNMGERMGGMAVAGLFLREFVPRGVRWAHLDVAGPAFNEGGPYGYTSKGGTGVPTRTLIQLAADVADGTVTLG